MISDRFAVHTVEFPYSDSEAVKRRPAVVIVAREFMETTGNVLLSMVTSAKHSQWPGDVALSDLSAAGLTRPSKVRLRILTVSIDRLGPRIGALSDEDARELDVAITTTLTRRSA